MLQDLFPRHYRHYEGSRFAAELGEFAGWLWQLGYSRHSLRGHLGRLRRVLEGSEHTQTGGTFSETDLREAFAFFSPPADNYRATQRVFGRFLMAMGQLSVAAPKDALEALFRRYCQHLSDVRGFAGATIQQHQSTLQDFRSRGLPTGRKLSDLAADDIEAYVLIRSKEVNRHTLQHVVGHLRSFLRYCANHDETRRGLEYIDTLRTYRGELPPRALDWTVVKKLIASVDRKSPNGWRDYAILHLMAYYGLPLRDRRPEAELYRLECSNHPRRPTKDAILTRPALGEPNRATATALLA